MFLAFEGLHSNIKILVLACLQQKLFKGNDQKGEREQTIMLKGFQCDISELS